MSISFGGLGLMSLRNPFTKLAGMIIDKSDVKSIFCAVVFFVVFLILAYLTNPSESSFRAYLTEQSFRQHLSRLDDNTEDDQSIQDSNSSAHLPCHTHGFEECSPFHFANRASVSLKTPKHAFHSFGIFTVAAMVQTDNAERNSADRDGSRISDSWFIGAFGRWCRGGVIEAWYHDVISKSKDEESWSSGILRINTSDKLKDYNSLPFSTKSLPPHITPTRGSPPKLRNRDRSSHRLPARTSSPPPLPKSASLPLHTTRYPSSTQLSQSVAHTLQVPSHSTSSLSPSSASDQVRLGSPVVSRSPSTLFEHSPLITEVLRQITSSKSTVVDLRTQLADFQSTASQSHASLQAEVDSYRDRKRQEDASKLDLKSRTKLLEDSKRNAESVKRDAEKRLKAAHNARDDASQRVEHLDKEIAKLQQRVLDDEISARKSKEEVEQTEQDIARALEHKKQEIKVAEDVIAALNLRAREIEDKIVAEKERLKLVRERADIWKQDRSFYHSPHILNNSEMASPWSPISYGPSYDSAQPHSTADYPERSDVFPPVAAEFNDRRVLTRSRDVSGSPRPAKLALGGISNFNGITVDSLGHNARLRTNGYAIFDDDLAILHQAQTSFSPFEDHESMLAPPVQITGVSPTSTSLIPNSLISSLDSSDSTSRSFQSDSDVYIDREWHGRQRGQQRLQLVDTQNRGPGPLTSSPVSLNGPPLEDHDPFEVRIMPSYRDRMASGNPMDTQRASLLHRARSDPNSYQLENDEPMEKHPSTDDKSSPRRWFSTSFKEKPKKGLNPDAKVFSLPSMKSTPKVIVASSPPDAPRYDALNPNGLVSSIMSSSTSANSSLLRAFAPSPAEREALQRALGGSTNGSLERLPSLSDVGSIPPSPSHDHAHATLNPPHFTMELGRVLPSWLQSLPRIKKPNFSPWEDDEPAEATPTSN